MANRANSTRIHEPVVRKSASGRFFGLSLLTSAGSRVQSCYGSNQRISAKNAAVSPPEFRRERLSAQMRALWPVLRRRGYAQGLHDGERQSRHRGSRRPYIAGPIPARRAAPHRHACRLRYLAVRRLRRPCGRQGDQVLHHVRLGRPRARTSPRSRASPRTASCIRCRKPSASITACSAASARRA